MAGTALFCKLDWAVAATRAAIPDVPRSYRHSPDGAITARTAIRFIDLVTYNLAPTSARQLAQRQPAFQTLLPFTITISIDSHGRLDRAELNGRFTTDGEGYPEGFPCRHVRALATSTSADPLVVVRWWCRCSPFRSRTR